MCVDQIHEPRAAPAAWELTMLVPHAHGPSANRSITFRMCFFLLNLIRVTYSSAPFRSWSDFEVFKLILASVRLEWLSTATSLNDSWEEASYSGFVTKLNGIALALLIHISRKFLWQLSNSTQSLDTHKLHKPTQPIQMMTSQHIPYLGNNLRVHLCGCIKSPDKIKVIIITNVLVVEDDVFYLWDQIGYVCWVC